MFGPCEIEYEGRKYFGNVTLREFHIFQYDGSLYLVNVEKKAACSISRRLADLIGRLAFDPSWLVPESVMLELRGLKLIAGEEGGATMFRHPVKPFHRGRRLSLPYQVSPSLLPRSAICAVYIATVKAVSMGKKG